MREQIRMSDDPMTPNQRVRVVEELAEWGMVSIHDEDVTSRSEKAQAVSATSVQLTSAEARWLRDVLNGLDLGDDSDAARIERSAPADLVQAAEPHPALMDICPGPDVWERFSGGY